MAYIYTKKIGEKEYFYLRESIRKSGKTITRDIAYLGNNPEDIKNKLKNLPSKYTKGIKNRLLNNEEEWMLAEDIPDLDLFFSQVWLSCFVNEFEHKNSRPYRKILAVFKGYHLWFYFLEKDSYEVGQNIVNIFLKDPDFALKINKEIIEKADKLKSFAQNLPESNLTKLSNQNLCDF